jgi:hypothetical protein
MKARTFRHRNGRYLWNRRNEVVYHLRHPEHPWLTWKAVELLRGWLKPTDVAIEFGSGRSTLWFVHKVARLTSVEHDAAWFERISSQLREVGIQNVEYHLFEENEAHGTPERSGYR